ncbi:MAG: ABC transporter ATP-binding protein [Syntrophales bacterium]|jgi:lipopolysaccharide transport system ATP-binding protein|nr:ABC transporter ATP-binding protein [Syntrophales bacterium]MDX9922891.1 ABC transporter ATP-binding protein [Syntrophales bacterium]
MSLEAHKSKPLYPNQKGNRIITLENVGLCYSRRLRFLRHSHFWALQDVSFDLYAGETLGVIGRNGCGKSTLLRVLGGIIAPNKGKIIVHQPNLKITMISIGAGFVPHLSGRENAILSGMLLGAKKQEIASRLDDIVAFSELNGFFEEPVNTYSTGMRARLGFSVAYHLDPDVILLDEVLGVGDEAFKEKSTAAMKRRIKSDKTVVLVSHVIPLIQEICDRLIWIENGKTQAQGKVPKVLEAYRKSIVQTRK